MSDDFYVSPAMRLMHYDGWGYRIEHVGEGLISVFPVGEGVEEDGEEKASILLWPDGARKLAGILVKTADMISPEEQPEEGRSIEFQNGFLAGLAYSKYGDEAVKAAKAR